MFIELAKLPKNCLNLGRSNCELEITMVISACHASSLSWDIDGFAVFVCISCVMGSLINIQLSISLTFLVKVAAKNL